MYLNNILYLSTIAKKYSFVWLIHLYSAYSIQYSDTLQVLMFVCPTVPELLWMLLSLSLFQISPMILGSNSIVKLNRIKKFLKMKVVKFSLSSIFFTLPGCNKWMQNIRGYYDKRKIFVNLGCKFPSLLLFRPFNQ